MMRDQLECTVCKGRDLWNISEVLERDMGLTRMPVWIDGAGQLVGSFELLICAGCGLAEWWAHGVGPGAVLDEPRAKLVPDAPACPSCAATEAWNVPMMDQATGLGAVPMAAALVSNRPANPLFTWVCRPCGLTRWRIRPDDPFVPDSTRRTEPCRACRSGQATVVFANDATTEVTGASAFHPPTGQAFYMTRFVAGGQGFWGPRWWGRFELRVCTDCGHVDWLGTSLDQLEESEKFGIRKLSGRAPSTRGPYR